MKTAIKYGLTLIAVFLVIFYYRAAYDVLTASGKAVSGTINKLQGVK